MLDLDLGFSSFIYLSSSYVLELDLAVDILPSAFYYIFTTFYYIFIAFYYILDHLLIILLHI